MLLMHLWPAIFLIGGVYGAGADLDTLIQGIFNNSKPNTGSVKPTKGTTTTTIRPDLQPKQPELNGGNSDNCACVPYYLCNNGTVNTNGENIIDIRLRECESYLDVCCETKDRNPEPVTKAPPTKTVGCGFRNPDGTGFRITGDRENESQFGEFPWMVALLREEVIEGNPQALSVYQCGGALIHPQAVITAAHCVSGKTNKFKIRAGEWDTQTTKELYPHQDREVKSIVIHPEFYAGALFNDIAILFLDSPVDLAVNVNPLCLPPAGTVPDHSKCIASGWGKDVFGKEGKYQVILKKIELPIVPRAPCQEKLRNTRLGKYFELHKSFICAGGETGKDTCKGDGGSPLVCPVPGTDNQYYHAGIVAWGIECGKNNTPGVYVNVPFFRDWIDEQMRALSYDTGSYSYT